MNVVGIIPARAGSKGIPNKSLIGGPKFEVVRFDKDYLVHEDDQPCLLQWVEDRCWDSTLLNELIIATDDEDTLDIYDWSDVLNWRGTTSFKRSEASATADSPTEVVIGEVISHLPELAKESESETFNADIIVILQPTSPLREGRHIDEAVQLLIDSGADSVVSVSPWHGFLWLEGADGPIADYEFDKRPMRQDQQYWKENGAIYVFTREHWERTGNRLGGKVELYKMGEEHLIEVDTPLDLELARAAYEHCHSR